MPNFSGIWTVTQQMQAKGQSIWPEPAPTIIGEAFGGGFYAGQIGVSSVATHYLIVGPVASAENSSITYKNANTATTGADSVIDGPQNTADMVAGGSSTVYPAAHFCNDLVIGGYSDWYMPAKNEMLVCYFNLKPSTQGNNASFGINPNAVPARTSNNSSGSPATNPTQTSAAAFQNITGAQAFQVAEKYWSSTEFSATYAWWQNVDTGGQYGYYGKTQAKRVRATRRIPV